MTVDGGQPGSVAWIFEDPPTIDRMSTPQPTPPPVLDERIQERRQDASFRDRLRRLIDRNREALQRLAGK